MKRLRVILRAALIGAVAGAVATLFRLHGGATIAATLFDKAQVRRWPWMAAALGWIAFSLYWEAAAKNAAPAKSAESRASRAAHVFLVNAALLMELAPIRGVGRFLPVASSMMVGGLAVEGSGLLLAIQARRHLGSYWSGEISIKVDHRLIRSGPYKRLRHPIYTGLLAMYAGTAAVTGTWLALAGLAMAAVAFWRKIRLEEANLDVAFGAEYQAYRRETWALVPGLF